LLELFAKLELFAAEFAAALALALTLAAFAAEAFAELELLFAKLELLAE